MTVFIVHPVNDDLTQAKKFGEFRYINERYVYGDELEEQRAVYMAAYVKLSDLEEGIAATCPDKDWVTPETHRHNMMTAAYHFGPNDDYLLIAGDHLQLLHFTFMLAARYQFFRVLRYDRKISDYIPVRLDYRLADRHQSVLQSSNIGDRPDAQAGSQESHVTRKFRARQGVLDESGLATPDRTHRGPEWGK